MEDRNHENDEVMLPGFRFHPTDEELVGFYLIRKVQQKPLSVELIKHLDIYKYDPWDLPKMATTGEKEWYFYCPRDRKYRNSARPNRVTGAGFWKATGTDRPIYASDGNSKCIGLKKSLVFYKGKAAKGIKTDWMMHEFRLPSVSDSLHPKKFLDKGVPANEAWAICRIFKKANSTAQRAMSQSWISPVFDSPTSDLTNLPLINSCQFSSSNLTMANLQFGFCNDVSQSSMASFSPVITFPLGKPIYQMETNYKSHQVTDSNPKCGTNNGSLLQDVPNAAFEDNSSNNMEFNTCNDLISSMVTNMNGQGEFSQNVEQLDEPPWGSTRTGGFSYNTPLSLSEGWKTSFLWDSSPCPSELSTNYCANK